MQTSNPSEQHIEILAYEFWIERGCPFGSPEVDWYRAVETLSVEEGLLLAAFPTWLNTEAPRRQRRR